MKLDLTNRKVVVTGAGDGIGRALALAFAASGARVAGCARSEDRLHSLAEQVEGEGHLFSPADLTRADDVQAFHDQVMETLGGADVLVNNVGSIVKLADFFALTDEDWQTAFDVNLMSCVRMCRAFIPALRHSGSPAIINISSIAGSRPGDIFPHYSAMKAGMSNLTISLAQSLAKDKIRVNAISPGPVWTRSWEKEAEGFAEHSQIDPNEAKEQIRSNTEGTVLLQRMGLPEDITGLALLLASDQASWITGSNFTVDGGVLLTPY